MTSFESKRVLVVGLGRFGGGVGVARWLSSRKARVVVTDQARPEDLRESLAQVQDLDIELRLGRHEAADLDGCDLVVVNPAVDKTRSSLFQEIVRRGTPWTTELNLFCERCPCATIGVTGSFGKSTTCAMIAAGLEAATEFGVAERRIYLGGNIGRSLLDELENMTPRDIVVLELSSAQLEDTPRISWAPDVAVITNIRPHHLDRHGTYEDYIASKLHVALPPREANRLVWSGGAPPLVVGLLDATARAMLHERLVGHPRAVIPVQSLEPDSRLIIPGDHNRANAACALTAIRAIGELSEGAKVAVSRFTGLPDRLELVADVAGVTWINDSKSTAPSATVTALRSLAGQTILAIVGGQRKLGVSYDELAVELCARCRSVVCFGESGPAIAAAISAAGGRAGLGAIPIRVAGRVADALAVAASLTEPGDRVLFSPGTPSFDEFHNYSERGRRFTQLVRELPSAGHTASSRS